MAVNIFFDVIILYHKLRIRSEKQSGFRFLTKDDYDDDDDDDNNDAKGYNNATIGSSSSNNNLKNDDKNYDNTDKGNIFYNTRYIRRASIIYYLLLNGALVNCCTSVK